MKTQSLLALCACLCLSCTNALAQAEAYTELREQTPARWTQTYQTKWRDVEINAAIELPDADTVPILQIGYDNRTPALTQEESGWDSVEARDGSLILGNNDPKMPHKVDGRKINQNQEASGQWYDGFTPESTYVPLCDTAFGDITAMMNEELAKFGYDPADFQVESPLRLWAQHWYYYGRKKDALPGTVLMEIEQKTNGLPILNHVFFAVTNPNGERRSDEYWECFRVSAGYDGITGRLSHLFIPGAKVHQVLAQDVPLCSFDTVQKTVMPLITEGHIRKIYEVQFGYLLYNEPGVYQGKSDADASYYESMRFYAKPVWQVNCLYTASGKDKLRETSSYTSDERNSLDYRQLMVDAQTGLPIEQSSAQDRCEYKGFIAWDEVK